MTPLATLFILLFWGAWAIIAYTYFVFPLLLAAGARLATRRERRFRNGAAEARDGCLAEPEELPRVAMVVAAYNEENTIGAKLANTWQLDYPAHRLQLYVGSDGSDDCTNAVLRGCPDPRLHAACFAKRRGKISVLNDLMREVDADIVVMSDANTMYRPDAIRRLVQPFDDRRVGCVSGELHLAQNGGVSGEGIYWKYEQWVKRNESRLGFLIGANGAIFALRRGLYRPLPASTIIEDFVLTMRVLEQGFRVCFVPEARAVEPPCVSARAEMVRKIRIGAGGFQSLGLTRKLLHPRFGFRAFAFWGHKVIRWFVPFFIGISLVAGIVLSPQSRFFLAATVAQMAGLAVAACSYNPCIGRRLPRWTKPVSYFYLMNYALLLGFLRFLFRTQRVTWDRAPAPAAAPVFHPVSQASGSSAAPAMAVVRVRETPASAPREVAGHVSGQ